MKSPKSPTDPMSHPAFQILHQLEQFIQPVEGDGSGSARHLLKELADSIKGLLTLSSELTQQNQDLSTALEQSRQDSHPEVELRHAQEAQTGSAGRRPAEPALQENEERFRSILENSQDAPYRRNLQTDRYDYISPTIETQLGWSAADMQTADIQTVLARIHPEDVARVDAEINRTNAECRQTGRSSGRLEYRFLGQDGRYRYIADQITVLAGPDGNPLYRVGMVRDITERKLADEALHQSQTLLNAVMAGIPEPIFLKDLASRMLLANPATLAVIGKPAEEVIGTDDIAHFDDQPIGRTMVENDRRVMETGLTQVFEEKVLSAGQERILLATKTPFRDAEGNIIGTIGVARDITERKENEDKLSRLNRTLRALSASNQAMLHARTEVELMNEVCKIIREDCGHTMVWIGFAEHDEAKSVRPVAYAGFEDGYLETLNVTWADTERGRGPTGVSIRTGKPSFCRNMLTDPNFAPWREQAMKRGYASSLALPMIIENEVIGMLCIYSSQPDPFSEDEVTLLTELVGDLTYGLNVMRVRAAHVAAAEALKSSEERYRSLFERMTEGFALHEIICDEFGQPCDYRFLEINPSFERLTGFTRQEIVGQLKSVVMPNDDPIWLETYGQVALTGQPVHFENYSSVLNRHYEVFAYRSAPMQFAVLFMDISERKQGEAERERLLKEVEAERTRWLVAFENTPEMVLMSDAAENIIYMNPVSRASMKSMGMAIYESRGARPHPTHASLYTPDGRSFDANEMPIHQAIRQQKTVDNIQITQRSQDGQEIDVLWNAAPMIDASGNLLGAVAVGRDITRLRRVENELRETNARLYSVLTNMIQAHYSLDSAWRFIEINSAAEEIMFLRPAKELIGKVIWEEYPQAVNAEIYHQYHTAVDRKQPVHFETHSVVREAWYEVNAYPNEGQLDVYLRDITERKQAEIQIEALARFPQENPSPVMRVDQDGKLLFANASSRVILQALNFQNGVLLSSPWREQVVAVLAGQKPEITTLHCGETIYELSFIPIAGTNYLNIYGRNITEQVKSAETLRRTLAELEQRVENRTAELSHANRSLRAEAEERKRAEESLRRANAYNRSLLEASLDPMVTITPDGKISDVNLATELVTGRSRQELIGTDFHEYFTDPQKAEAGYQKVFENGTARDLELEIRHKDGTLTQVLYNAALYRDEHGKTVGVFAAARDITLRKLAEELINLQTTALEAAANGITITDSHGIIQWANQAFAQMTGYSILEIAGQNMRMLKSGKHDEQFYQKLWQTILDGQIWRGEITNRRKDGSLYIEEQTITPVKDETGRITHFVAVKQDITERKNSERILQQQEALLRTVLDNLPVGVWLADASGKLYRSNAAARQIWEGERYVGPSDYGVYKGWYLETGQEIAPDDWAAARAARTGRTYLNEPVEIQCFDGTHKFMLNSVIPLYDSQQQIYGIVCVNQDITEIRQTQKDLENALAHEQALREQMVQVEKYTAVGRMVASITHELNNPLQSIKNCLYLTRQELPENAAHPFLEMASAEVQRLSILVSQLREVYRPRSAGQKQLLNLSEILVQVRVLVHHQLESAKVGWQQKPTSETFYVFGIADQLKQVFLNISLNAIEAMQATGGSLQIEFVTDPETNRQGILFRDQGPGISPENLSRLFEPLFSTKQSGMGLGLSISMDIVQNHGGQITVDSQLGAGSTFTVWLPLLTGDEELKYQGKEENDLS